MRSSKTCVLALVAIFGLAKCATAQNGAVDVSIVSSKPDKSEATVKITVTANFKGNRGSHTFPNVLVKKREPKPKKVSTTKSGFVYTVNVSFQKNANTIKAEATIRSKYGTVKATGTAKL